MRKRRLDCSACERASVSRTPGGLGSVCLARDAVERASLPRELLTKNSGTARCNNSFRISLVFTQLKWKRPPSIVGKQITLLGFLRYVSRMYRA